MWVVETGGFSSAGVGVGKFWENPEVYEVVGGRGEEVPSVAVEGDAVDVVFVAFSFKDRGARLGGMHWV